MKLNLNILNIVREKQRKKITVKKAVMIGFSSAMIAYGLLHIGYYIFFYIQASQ